MKTKLSSIYLRTITLVTVIAGNIILFAQPPGGPPPGGGGGAAGSTPPCWEPECIPIDGGLSFLLVAGAALGAKKIYGQLR